MENEAFPEYSIVLLENCFFQPEEIGFRIEEATENSGAKVIKYSREERTAYIKAVSEYCPIYIIDDKENI